MSGEQSPGGGPSPARAPGSEQRPLELLLSCFVPGALAGTQLAGLLFFLNPHAPFSPGPVLRGFSYYAALGGLASTMALLVLSRGRVDVSRRWLPLWMAATMVVAAAGFWVHASYFGYYLPPGINTRLLKAAIWLSLGAVICFYTVVLHQWRRRPYGRRSKALFVLTALASVYVVVERREAFQPLLEPEPRSTTFGVDSRPQLCVVGLETATLDALLPLAEQERLPFLRAMLNEGTHMRVSSLRPTRRNPLWTTLATGKYPYKHGVANDHLYEAYLGRRAGPWLSLLPLGLEGRGQWVSFRRSDQRDVRVLSIWRILSRLGMSTAVVGWPATSPPAPEVAVTLPDRFFIDDDFDKVLVAPQEMAARARLFRTTPEDLPPSSLSRFGDRPPKRVLEALANDQWRGDLALYLLESDNASDALFLLLPGLSEVSREYYGGFSATRFRGVQAEESMAAARLLTAYYEHVDGLLQKLWNAMREPRMMVVVSAYGVEEAQGVNELRRLLLREPAQRGYVDGADGMLLFRGQGIGIGEGPRQAQLIDLPPTLLYGLGFPVARDFDGGVLTQVFDKSFMARRPLSFVASYEAFEIPEQDP